MADLRSIRGQRYTWSEWFTDSLRKYTIVGVGNVSKVYADGARVKVTSANLRPNGKEENWDGLEVLWTGSKLVDIKQQVQEGDCAIVLASSTLKPTMETDAKPEAVNFAPFSMVTMKAIIIQPSDASSAVLHVSVTDSAVEINSTVDVTLKCDGNVTATANQFDFNSGALTVTS